MNTEASAGGVNAAHATAKDGRVAVSAPPAADMTRPSVLVEKWPEPYLQPDRTQDCGYYSVAYIGRCYGLDVTADEVKAWRAETNRHEDHYLLAVHGIPMRKPHDDGRHPRWWMGPDQREWVASTLSTNVCLVHLLRIPTMHHSVVALEAREDGVLLMDPIYGHVVEPWDWFLGPGPGTRSAHALWSAHPHSATAQNDPSLCPGCGNVLGDDNLCMVSACERET